jgi:hypothetical protein
METAGAPADEQAAKRARTEDGEGPAGSIDLDALTIVFQSWQSASTGLGSRRRL